MDQFTQRGKFCHFSLIRKPHDRVDSVAAQILMTSVREPMQIAKVSINLSSRLHYIVAKTEDSEDLFMGRGIPACQAYNMYASGEFGMPESKLSCDTFHSFPNNIQGIG